MSKKQKLLKRLQSSPSDFTFDEACTLLTALGFSLSQGKGSRVKFVLGTTIVAIHKPHPQKELKGYQITEIINKLREARLV
ncbi:MAG: type II toxin-antitoxin system HicA family toxin [Oscillospiraceae bacterium]|jgi:predicted RNA binding protein YcfA (HicA-like mRNA interferase family)|nr:type II toxin-antitoxin system HicA family toxin [Oscillospiraceae bacterium]